MKFFKIQDVYRYRKQYIMPIKNTTKSRKHVIHIKELFIRWPAWSISREDRNRVTCLDYLKPSTQMWKGKGTIKYKSEDDFKIGGGGNHSTDLGVLRKEKKKSEVNIRINFCLMTLLLTLYLYKS